MLTQHDTCDSRRANEDGTTAVGRRVALEEAARKVCRAAVNDHCASAIVGKVAACRLNHAATNDHQSAALGGCRAAVGKGAVLKGGMAAIEMDWSAAQLQPAQEEMRRPKGRADEVGSGGR